jgi:hypothetical protein
MQLHVWERVYKLVSHPLPHFALLKSIAGHLSISSKALQYFALINLSVSSKSDISTSTMASITRPTHLLTSRVWPQWLPTLLAKAEIETERRALISSLPTISTTLTMQTMQAKPSFHFSACLSSLFSLQDAILGVQNPLNQGVYGYGQQARAFSQHQRGRAMTTPNQVMVRESNMELKRGRERRALTLPSAFPSEKEQAKLERFKAMESRILNVL